MEEIDKNIMEVARTAVKEYLERLMTTERDVFLDEHGGLRDGFVNKSSIMRKRMITSTAVLSYSMD